MLPAGLAEAMARAAGRPAALANKEGPMDEEERERDSGAPVGDAARGVPSQTYTIWAQPNDAGVNQRLKAWCRGPY